MQALVQFVPTSERNQRSTQNSISTHTDQKQAPFITQISRTASPAFIVKAERKKYNGFPRIETCNIFQVVSYDARSFRMAECRQGAGRKLLDWLHPLRLLNFTSPCLSYIHNSTQDSRLICFTSSWPCSPWCTPHATCDGAWPTHPAPAVG